jgi:hypothetical protein
MQVYAKGQVAQTGRQADKKLCAKNQRFTKMRLHMIVEPHIFSNSRDVSVCKHQITASNVARSKRRPCTPAVQRLSGLKIIVLPRDLMEEEEVYDEPLCVIFCPVNSVSFTCTEVHKAGRDT